MFEAVVKGLMMTSSEGPTIYTTQLKNFLTTTAC